MFGNRKHRLLFAFFSLAVFAAVAESPKGVSAVAQLRTTDSAGVTPARTEALDVLQKAADSLTSEAFQEYVRKAGPESARERESESLTLWFYNDSFDRVLRDFQATRVAPGSLAIWHIYNMGYLFKTPTRSYGIDLYHRRAAELAPHLDALFITHNHGDHFWKPLIDAMEAAGKPVISNFRPGAWRWKEPGVHEAAGLSVRVRQVDHNRTLLKFVNIYEINFGPETGNCVVLHTGDACAPAQFEVKNPVDIFIPHIRVGMNIEEAVRDYVHPRYVLMSHVLELGHPVGKARWSYRNGLDDCARVTSCPNVWMPVWGEKLLWDGETRTLRPVPVP